MLSMVVALRFLAPCVENVDEVEGVDEEDEENDKEEEETCDEGMDNRDCSSL